MVQSLPLFSILDSSFFPFADRTTAAPVNCAGLITDDESLDEGTGFIRLYVHVVVRCFRSCSLDVSSAASSLVINGDSESDTDLLWPFLACDFLSDLRLFFHVDGEYEIWSCHVRIEELANEGFVVLQRCDYCTVFGEPLDKMLSSGRRFCVPVLLVVIQPLSGRTFRLVLSPTGLRAE